MTLKGNVVVGADLFLVDPAGRRETKLRALDGVADPAWRPAAAVTAADAAARPCMGRGTGRTLRGAAYDDLIVGSDRAQTILGGAGNDWIEAAGGRDTVDPGSGRDEVWTGRGTDVIRVRDHAADLVHCGEGPSDTGLADRPDRLLGACRRVLRR